MMGWLVTLFILCLLAVLPLGVQVCYDADGPRVGLIAGPVRIRLYPPGKKKEKKPAKEKTPKKKKEQPPPQSNAPKEKRSLGGTVEAFRPFVKMGLDFLGDLRRKIRIDVLDLSVTMAADDPYDLAVNYGRAWAAAGNLVTVLTRAFVIRKKHIRIACDFEAEKTVIFLRLDITITLGRILALLVRYGIRALKQLRKSKISSKKVESV